LAQPCESNLKPYNTKLAELAELAELAKLAELADMSGWHVWCVWCVLWHVRSHWLYWSSVHGKPVTIDTRGKPAIPDRPDRPGSANTPGVSSGWSDILKWFLQTTLNLYNTHDT
jgi:hypothetical protein